MPARIELPALIDLVYGAAVDPQQWGPALEGIADALGASAMSFVFSDVEARRPPTQFAPRTAPAWLADYASRWAYCNFLEARSDQFPVGTPLRFESLIPRGEFEGTEFYKEFWAPQSMNTALLTTALVDDSARASFGFYRSWKDGDYGAQEERLFQVLIPHFRRASELSLRLGRLEMQRASGADMLDRLDQGALLVDSDARVLFANRVAEAILRDRKGLRVDRRQLVTSRPAETATLRRMIYAGLKGGAGGLLALPRDGRPPLMLLVIPLKAETSWIAPIRPAAILFIRDPEQSSLPEAKQLEMLFGLTPAQAALAREILVGDGVQAAADRLGISFATARTHLLQVFQKTSTSRQAELVRLILQSLSGLPNG